MALVVDHRLVALQARRRGVVRAHGVEGGLGRQHAAAHRQVDALEPHRVHEVRGVADDQAAVHEEARLRVPAALGQRLRAVLHHLPALEHARDERVQLEALERRIRIEQRILVVEADDEADRHLSVGHRVEPAAAELLLAQRVAQRVDHGAGRQAIPRDLPQFLDADRELRRLAVLAELQDADQLLGEVAAHAVGEDRDLGLDVGARLEHAARLSVAADAAVAGADADHAVAIEQHRLPGKAPEQVDAFGLDLRRQPLRELVQRDDVVAVVLERRRRDRQPQLLLRGEEVDVVLLHLAGQRRALGLEVRDQLPQRGRDRAARPTAGARRPRGPSR